MNAPENFLNVQESWPIYDTLIVCPSLYGPEASVPGWFTTFAAMSARQDHSLFKTRSEANAGLYYNNQQSQDRTDFAFKAFSLGLRFFAPANRVEFAVGSGSPAPLPPWDQSAHFWTVDLPRHVGVELRIGQDIKLQSTGYRLPSGYGVAASGAAYGSEGLSAVQKEFNFHVSQGVPDISNRFVFRPPIGIPRNETIEVRLLLSDYARYVLSNMPGPGEMFEAIAVGEGYTYFKNAARYGIQASLWGIREVQQRGQLHA